MRLTVAAVPVVVGRFDLKIREPAIVRHVAFEQKKALVMQRGAPEFEEVPVLFIESTFDAPIRTKNYCVIEHGDSIVVEDDEVAVWVASGTGAQLGVVHVFEMRRVDGGPAAPRAVS